MITPAPFQPGDLIQVVAPGSPFKRANLLRGVRVLEGFGFKAKYSPRVFLKDRYLAGSTRERAADLLAAIKNPQVKAIYCARGGYGAAQLLPYLEKVKSCRKWLLGFSDVSALHLLWNLKFKTVSLHAPLLTTLADSGPQVQDAVCRMLYGLPVQSVSMPGVKTVFPGSGTGQLWGGNLTVLCHLVGSPFFKPPKNGVLFLEDVGERAYAVDRMLTHLKLADVFKHVSAVLLGDFSPPKNCPDPASWLKTTLREFFHAEKIPCLTGLPAGHVRHNFPLPLGQQVAVNASRGHVLFHAP